LSGALLDSVERFIMSKRRVHYVLSTHWDREWHQSFQGFRYQLVQLLDRVIAGFDSGELKGPFQTDGQSIILEDYLEVRPERRARCAIGR
jgi:alpha-mannosidase